MNIETIFQNFIISNNYLNETISKPIQQPKGTCEVGIAHNKSTLMLT